MAEIAASPFDGYTLYKVYHKGEKRMMAQLVKSEKDRTTMSLSRYMMCVHLGRILGKDEHVDHINDDKSDDRLDNLQILTPLENSAKYAKTNPRKYVERSCPVCGVNFMFIASNLPFRPNPTCSRRCGGIKSWEKGTK